MSLSFNIREAAEDVLAGLRERSGLIIGPGIYSFVHKSVLEFLVAECVVQGDRKDESGCRIDRLTLFEHRNDDRWNTVIFLWAGLAPVADVESFIQQCIEVEIWDLAYGILYDQYDRFAKKIRCDLIMKILLKNIDFQGCNRGLWYRDLYKTQYDQHFKFSTFGLRSITPHSVSFHNLLLVAVSDSDLVWSDIKHLKEPIITFLWIACATEIADIEQWKNCINECCLGDLYYNYGITLVLRTVFEKNRNNQILAEKVLTVFIEIHPNLNVLLSVALIAICFQPLTLKILDPSKSEKHEFNTPEFNKILSEVKVLELLSKLGSISDFESCKNVRDVLVGTSKWSVNFISSESEYYDLFTNFINKLEQIIEQGLLPYDGVATQAIDYVKYLMECRDKLVNDKQNQGELTLS
jgi:hypothetical protein